MIHFKGDELAGVPLTHRGFGWAGYHGDGRGMLRDGETGDGCGAGMRWDGEGVSMSLEYIDHTTDLATLCIIANNL